MTEIFLTMLGIWVGGSLGLAVCYISLYRSNQEFRDEWRYGDNNHSDQYYRKIVAETIMLWPFLFAHTLFRRAWKIRNRINSR